MGNILPVLRVCALTLFAAETLLTLVRMPQCGSIRAPLGVALVLCLLMTDLLIPELSAAHAFLSVAIVWAAGAALSEMNGAPAQLSWHLASLGFFAVLVIAFALGYSGSVFLRWFHAFGMCLLALQPLRLLHRGWRATGRVVFPAFLAGAGIWLAMSAAGFVLQLLGLGQIDTRALPIALLALCAGMLVFHEGFPSRSWEPGGEAHLRDLYARLLRTENALVLQDRLIASGLLALGAAHEFKNSLSHMRVSAEAGLSQANPDRKDECFRLLLEHADAGRQSAVALLESLAKEGREEPRLMEARRDLAGLARLLAANYRGLGLHLRAALSPDVGFVARKNEVEQILLNLVRNAADGYRDGTGDGAMVIELAARLEGDRAVIEIRDESGGVPQSVAHKLFSISSSGKGSTGLGLYLSRALAERNGGTLEYMPTERGSSFRLSFPRGE